MQNAPALKIDKVLYAKQPMLPRCKRERRVMWNLLLHLKANAWFPFAVYDGEATVATSTPLEAMEVIFNLDDAILTVQDTAGHRHGIKIVLGNDLDIISDWNYTEGDADGFSKVMDQFNAEDYA